MWRTASASDSQGGNEDYNRKEMDGKAPRIKLKLQATHKAMYPTPSASEHKARLQGNSQQSNGLTAKVKKNWPTALSRDYKGGSITKPRHSRLPDAATGSDLHHPQSMMTSDGHTHSLTCQRLNPLFVEWLMGFPLGWSNAYEPLEMQSFHQWQQRDLQNL